MHDTLRTFSNCKQLGVGQGSVSIDAFCLVVPGANATHLGVVTAPSVVSSGPQRNKRMSFQTKLCARSQEVALLTVVEITPLAAEA